MQTVALLEKKQNATKFSKQNHNEENSQIQEQESMITVQPNPSLSCKLKLNFNQLFLNGVAIPGCLLIADKP